MSINSSISLQVTPGGASSANIEVQLFYANSTTGIPILGIQATQDNSVAIPVTPNYVFLPLSTLLFSDASSTGSYYALVISTSVPVNWHSVADAALPQSGTSDVVGNWVRDYPRGKECGIHLSLLKVLCSLDGMHVIS